MYLHQEREIMRVSCKGPHSLEPCCDVPSGQAAEAGTFWVFVWPRLVSQPDVCWLFPFVSSEKNRLSWMRGNLWGVDAEGKLLIIRTKQKDKYHDPFKDFVRHQVPCVDDIMDYWQQCLAQELEFLHNHGRDLNDGKLCCESEYPGIVPYSKQRMEVKRWRHLYQRHVEPIFKDNYSERVEKYLRRYEEHFQQRDRNGAGEYIKYIVLFTLFDNERPTLFSEALESYGKLVDRVGCKSVRLISVQCLPPQVLFPGPCEIRSHELKLPSVS